MKDNQKIFENNKVDGFSFTNIRTITATYNSDIVYLETEDLLNFDTNIYQSLKDENINNGYVVNLVYNDIKIGFIMMLYKDKILLNDKTLGNIKINSKTVSKCIYELVN